MIGAALSKKTMICLQLRRMRSVTFPSSCQYLWPINERCELLCHAARSVGTVVSGKHSASVVVVVTTPSTTIIIITTTRHNLGLDRPVLGLV